MSNNSILQATINIDSTNNFLKYIVNRIKRNDYRGIHISQHNRYDLDHVEEILKAIYSIAKEKIFKVPPGDYKKNEGYKLNRKYRTYKNIVDLIKNNTGRGTYNSLKKNFFVDLDRMGFLERFNYKRELVNRKSRKGVYYAKLTDLAIEFINTKDLLKKYKIFTDAIDILFSGQITELANTLYYSPYKNTTISIYEFMFILSDTNLSRDEKICLLNAYRSLKQYQKERVIDLLKQYANPRNFHGNKITKRDFHNWKNESQQIFELLKTTVYFEVAPNRFLKLNIGGTGIFPEEYIKRSQSVKVEYFTYHKIKKKNNFELHHIVPINKARNKYEFKLIDNVKNLIYLSKNKHKEITKNNDANVYLCINPEKILLFDFNKNFISAQNKIDAIYSKNRRIINSLKLHNKKLIKQIYDFNNKIKCFS